MPSKRRRKRQVTKDDLHPGLAKGFTSGASAKEALEEHPVSTAPSGIEIARRFSAADQRATENPRDKGVHFIARLNPGVKMIEPNTGRQMIDAEVIMPQEHRRQILSGYRCLRCMERFEVAFPEVCDVCGYEVRERQILHAAHEFEGDVHVGPSKPMSEYLAEQDLRMAKREFDQKIIEGKSRGRRAS